MKIGIIGSFYNWVPLRPGQIHTPLVLTYDLAKGLSRLGHEVVYFGRVRDEEKIDSIKYVKYDYIPFPKELKAETSRGLWARSFMAKELSYSARAINNSDAEVFYTWAAFRIGPLAHMTDKKIVVSHHDSTNMKLYNSIFDSIYSPNLFMIPISEYMKEKIRYKNMLGVVHHGVETIRPQEPQNYFTWVGRITPSKGVHEAISLAKKNGFNLKIIGPMKDKYMDFGDVRDYNQQIKDEVKANQNIEYLGILNNQKTRDIISKSKGLIFPTSGQESFALIVIEAITSGVPVIAYDRGPMSELIDHGKTGFLCENLDDMGKCISQVDEIDREKCYQIGVRRFSLEAMAQGYERQFKKALSTS